MLGKKQLLYVYKTTLQKLIRKGYINNNALMASLDNFLSNHSNHMPILTPRFYDRLERNATPEKINDNYEDIESDFNVINDTINEILATNQHYERICESNLENVHANLTRIKMLMSNIDTMNDNAIAIIPDYVDEENSSVSIVEDKNIVTCGNILDAYRERIIPISSEIEILTDHYDFEEYGSFRNISHNNPREVIIYSKSAIPQTVRFTISTSTGISGLFIQTSLDYSYLMRSNICSNNIALYDSAMITSEIGMTTNIQLDITQSSYEKIKGGYYIYKIYLNELKLYTKIAEDISRLYTKPVDIASSYIILGGDVTGNVNAYMQVNGQNQTSIDFNTPQIVADVRYTTPSEPHDNAPGLIKLLAGADTGTYIRIKGPLGAMEKIGDSYICMLQLYEGGQISYPFDFHIGTENGTEFYPVGSYANLQAGIYKFIAKGVGEIESNVPYYIFIDHDYYYIAENPNNRFYSYPKYTYTIINDILYISSESLANVWGPTGYMAPLTAAQNLQVFIRSSVKNAVKFTIDLEKDAAISNLRLIETNNLSYVEDNQ